MPHTLRLTTLLQRDYRQYDFPLLQLRQQLSAIDDICRTLGVSPISHFVDISAIEWREAAQSASAETSELQMDPETGTALTIEDYIWHPCALGMASLDALNLHLLHGDNIRLQTGDLQPLLAELAWCIEHLAPLEADGGQFHLAAV